jgi:hypothetical protein
MPMADPVMLEVSEGINIPVYEDGELHEVSLLPEGDACSFFTRANITGGIERMNKRTEAALRLLIGDDAIADSFVADVDGTNRAIQDAGLLTRGTPTVEGTVGEANTEAQTTEEPTAELANAETEPEQDESPKFVTLAVLDQRLSDYETRMTEFQNGLNASLATLSTAVNTLTESITPLLQTEEAKREQWLSDLPAKTKVQPVTYRPREERRPQEEVVTTPSYAQVAAQTLSNLPKR